MPTKPRGGKGAPAGGTGGGKDGQHTEVGSRLHVTTTDSRTGQTSRRDGGGHRLASWTSGYATARSEAICRGAGCGRTRTSGSVGGQGQQRPWSTRPLVGTIDACPGTNSTPRHTRSEAVGRSSALADPDRPGPANPSLSSPGTVSGCPHAGVAADRRRCAAILRRRSCSGHQKCPTASAIRAGVSHPGDRGDGDAQTTRAGEYALPGSGQREAQRAARPRLVAERRCGRHRRGPT